MADHLLGNQTTVTGADPSGKRAGLYAQVRPYQIASVWVGTERKMLELRNLRRQHG
jgi:hypothetical protein